MIIASFQRQVIATKSHPKRYPRGSGRIIHDMTWKFNVTVRYDDMIPFIQILHGLKYEWPYFDLSHKEKPWDRNELSLQCVVSIIPPMLSLQLVQWLKQECSTSAGGFCCNHHNVHQVHRDHGRSGSTTRGFLRRWAVGWIHVSERRGCPYRTQRELRLVGLYKAIPRGTVPCSFQVLIFYKIDWFISVMNQWARAESWGARRYQMTLRNIQ